jgi:hypothetical protein
LEDIGAQEYLGDFISNRLAELPRRELGRSRFLIQLEEPIHHTTLRLRATVGARWSGGQISDGDCYAPDTKYIANASGSTGFAMNN